MHAQVHELLFASFSPFCVLICGSIPKQKNPKKRERGPLDGWGFSAAAHQRRNSAQTMAVWCWAREQGGMLPGLYWKRPFASAGWVTCLTTATRYASLPGVAGNEKKLLVERLYSFQLMVNEEALIRPSLSLFYFFFFFLLVFFRILSTSVSGTILLLPHFIKAW